MIVKELRELIVDLDDTAEVTLIDNNQDNCYNIVEGRVCEDKTSIYYKKYLDLVIGE